MNLAEHDEGEFRIYTAAVDAEGGAGYYAAVVVKPWCAPFEVSNPEVFRDLRLEDGAVWESVEDALDFAVQVGAAAVRAQRVFDAHFALSGCARDSGKQLLD